MGRDIKIVKPMLIIIIIIMGRDIKIVKPKLIITSIYHYGKDINFLKPFAKF